MGDSGVCAAKYRKGAVMLGASTVNIRYYSMKMVKFNEQLIKKCTKLTVLALCKFHSIVHMLLVL